MLTVKERVREQLKRQGMPLDFFDRGTMTIEEWGQLPEKLRVPHLFKMGITTLEDALEHHRRKVKAIRWNKEVLAKYPTWRDYWAEEKKAKEQLALLNPDRPENRKLARHLEQERRKEASLDEVFGDV